MTNFIFYILVFFTTYIGVAAFRRWSLRRELLDVPNERSSHTAPTPRGGGLVIVAVCLLCYTFLTNFITGGFQWSYLLGAVLIALISWIDDIYSISFVWRFLVHSISALLVIVSLGYFREIYFPFFQNEDIGIFGSILTFFWIVWLTNAYNFMDGIDGIAGMQAVTAGIGWFLIGDIFELPSASLYGGVIAAASFGFLIQNWQPAKIFMGDVGSAFLGYSFAVLPLIAKNESSQESGFQPISLIIGILLVWLFVFDTLWTFAGRVLRKEKVWEAHRSHIYQKLVIAGYPHQTVTILYGLISAVIVASGFFWARGKDKPEIYVMLTVILSLTGLLLAVYLSRVQKGKQMLQK